MDHSVLIVKWGEGWRCSCACGWEYRGLFGPLLTAVARLHSMLEAVEVENLEVEVEARAS